MKKNKRKKVEVVQWLLNFAGVIILTWSSIAESNSMLSIIGNFVFYCILFSLCSRFKTASIFIISLFGGPKLISMFRELEPGSLMQRSCYIFDNMRLCALTAICLGFMNLILGIIYKKEKINFDTLTYENKKPTTKSSASGERNYYNTYNSESKNGGYFDRITKAEKRYDGEYVFYDEHGDCAGYTSSYKNETDYYDGDGRYIGRTYTDSDGTYVYDDLCRRHYLNDESDEYWYRD